MEKHKYDYLFKLVMIEGLRKEKKRFLLCFIDNSFTSDNLTKLGIDCKVKIINFNNKLINLQIWDILDKTISLHSVNIL